MPRYSRSTHCQHQQPERRLFSVPRAQIPPFPRSRLQTSVEKAAMAAMALFIVGVAIYKLTGH